jgi:hypothetical protein
MVRQASVLKWTISALIAIFMSAPLHGHGTVRICEHLLLSPLAINDSYSQRDALSNLSQIIADAFRLGSNEVHARTKSILSVAKNVALGKKIEDYLGLKVHVTDPREILAGLDRLCSEYSGYRLEILEMKNYHGTGINPYLQPEILDQLPPACVGHLSVQSSQIKTAEKESGYTGLNIKILFDGMPAELQIHGPAMAEVIKVEHMINYSYRLNKPNFLRLPQSIRDQRHQLGQNKEQEKDYQNYLLQCFQAARLAETTPSYEIIYPDYPESIKEYPDLEIGKLIELEADLL